jgi:hypothetical protein
VGTATQETAGTVITAKAAPVISKTTNAVIPAKAGIWSRDNFLIRVTPMPGVYAQIMYWHIHDN